MNALINLATKGAQTFTQKVIGNVIANTFTRTLPSGIKYGVFFQIPNYALKKNYSACVSDLLAQGLNQAQIAKLLNISPSTVSRLARSL